MQTKLEIKAEKWIDGLDKTFSEKASKHIVKGLNRLGYYSRKEFKLKKLSGNPIYGSQLSRRFRFVATDANNGYLLKVFTRSEPALAHQKSSTISMRDKMLRVPTAGIKTPTGKTKRIFKAKNDSEWKSIQKKYGIISIKSKGNIFLAATKNIPKRGIRKAYKKNNMLILFVLKRQIQLDKAKRLDFFNTISRAMINNFRILEGSFFKYLDEGNF